MKSMSNLDFSGQDWRDRSFRNHNLRYADFTGADVRGCDFRGADLTGVRFTNARLGRTPRQIILTVIPTLLLVWLSITAFSQMIFGGLGTTRDHSAWGYTMALNVSLALAGGMTGVQRWRSLPPFCRQLCPILAHMATGALLGFFYGGTWSGNQAPVAIAAAIILGLLGIAVGWGWGPRWLGAGLTVSGAIAAYGFCFSAGTHASALTHTQQYGSGLLWWGISLAYLVGTVRSLSLAVERLGRSMGTCFSLGD
ncbi:MAG: pentapeptide repeat-containing protein [Leptolyngbyaceae bacterium]|nr:pentapeptide repeat-containing protein [Leptolyngbyaceae bacterium]